MLQSKMKGTRQAGFTLVEMMFTIILLAVLLGIGVPNFIDFVRNSRMAAAANDIIADYNFARSEAVKRRVPVTLCRSTDGEQCAAAGDFTGWIVFVDDANRLVSTSEDGNGVVDAGETVLRRHEVAEGITGTSDGQLTVFRPSGFPSVGVAGDLSRIVFCDSRGSALTTSASSAARGVSVSQTGRAVVTRDKAKIDAAVGAGGFGGCPE
jgi:type IV fimbrial biogenesis protein FimT